MTADKKFSFILASASPRRRELLTKTGYDFKIVPSNVDEEGISSEGILPEEYAKRLAVAKAEDVARKFPEEIVLGADTIADYEGEIIGKAADEKDAEKIVKKLFSRPHKIITGIAIVKLNSNIKIIQSDTTIVYPRKMTAHEIAEHISGGSWQDKAGAYAIQETGDRFVEKIEGSLTNVMGFPMELVTSLLEKLGIKPVK